MRTMVLAWATALSAVPALALWLATGLPAPAGPVVVTIPAPPPMNAPAAARPLFVEPGTAAPSLPMDGFSEDDLAMLEPSEHGPLPRIARDGRQPWQQYARPFDPGDQRPRIAVIVAGLGLRRALDEHIVATLPAGLTLAISPRAGDAVALATTARAAGHELMLSVPMEAAGAGVNIGPGALMTTVSPGENEARFRRMLAAFTGYVGVITENGSAFTRIRHLVEPVLRSTRDRGLMIVDRMTTPESVLGGLARTLGVPGAIVDILIDDDVATASVDALLAATEGIASEAGVALLVVEADIARIDRLAAWIATLGEKGFALAPVTAVANRQEIE